jgi:hypothetical protein
LSGNVAADVAKSAGNYVHSDKLQAGMETEV